MMKLSFSSIKFGEFARNLDRNRKIARDLGIPSLRHFAYPFGRYGMTAKRIAMESYASARTILWGVNRTNIDLGLLKSVPIYSRSRSLRLASYLDGLSSRNGWLILYTTTSHATLTLWLHSRGTVQRHPSRARNRCPHPAGRRGGRKVARSCTPCPHSSELEPTPHLRSSAAEGGQSVGTSA